MTAHAWREATRRAHLDLIPGDELDRLEDGAVAGLTAEYTDRASAARAELDQLRAGYPQALAAVEGARGEQRCLADAHAAATAEVAELRRRAATGRGDSYQVVVLTAETRQEFQRLEQEVGRLNGQQRAASTRRDQVQRHLAAVLARRAALVDEIARGGARPSPGRRV